MRKCKYCGEIKNIKDFYPNNKSCCKECSKKRSVQYQKNHSQRFKEYQINYRKDNSQKIKKRHAKYRADPDYRKKQAEYYREWYAKCGRNRAKNYAKIVYLWRKLNPEKCRTYHIVQFALKSGKLEKPKHCSKCGYKRKLVAHHDDYEFPLRVRWFCYSCHKKEHNKLK